MSQANWGEGGGGLSIAVKSEIMYNRGKQLLELSRNDLDNRRLM